MKGKDRQFDVFRLWAWLTGFVVLLVMCSCRSSRVLVAEQRDSVRVEVRDRVVYVPDTVLLPLPEQVMQRETRDTFSLLETGFAVSEARVSDGVLTHSLRNKAVSVPVRVDRQVVYKDSVVYRDSVKEVPVEVERKLTRWQQLRMDVGGWAMGLAGMMILALIGFVIYKVKRPLF